MPPLANSHPPTSSADWAQAPFEPDLTSKTPATGRSSTSHPTSDHRVGITSSSPSLHASHTGHSPERQNTLQPPNAASPAFSFDDYLTPEFSSENPQSEHSHQTTPSADDLWQDDEKDHFPVIARELHHLDHPGHDSYFLSSAGNAFGSGPGADSTHAQSHHLTTINQALLTPEMSTASMTPEGALKPTLPSNLLVSHLEARLDDQDSDRARPFSSHAGARSPSQKRKADADEPSYLAHTVSPVVMISTYNRGDSPARSQVPLSRSNSKRSQSSQLGRPTNAVASHDLLGLSSRLMPPAHPDHDSWEEDDDDDNDDNDDNNDRRDERTGLAPGHRDAEVISSVNDLERDRELAEKSKHVVHWLATSTAGSPAGSDDESRTVRLRKNRIRSRSTGARVDAMGLQIFSDSHIPGPGILIDEDSNYYYSDDDDDHVSGWSAEDDAAALVESPPAEINPNEVPPVDGYLLAADDDDDDNIAPDQSEPLSHQFIRRPPWYDLPRGPIVHDPSQPPTANAAIYILNQQAAKFETASRAATWGTGRRNSDSEIASVYDGTLMSRHLSLKDTITERARAHRSSLINSARKVLPGRSGSFVRKHQKPASRQASPDDKSTTHPTSPEPHDEHHKHRDSVGSMRQTVVRRLSSRGKSKPPKSPPHSTTSAFLAMTGQLTAVGGSSVHLTAEPESSRSPFLGTLKRVRSRSEVSKSPQPTHGLPDLITTPRGGPSVSTLASPLPMPASSPNPSAQLDEDMDHDGLHENTGVKMDLPVQTHNIIPDLEGFKTHARQLNPRLEPFLIERISQDQLKRFKRLVKNKIDHTRAVQSNKCASGAQCLSRGGKATILPPRTNGKDAPSNFAQFKVAPGGESDHDESNFVEGVVTPALFPPGIPLPPTTHLPAEFECPLCFQVKKFQKPSDWTKHVHEDVQPFSCTFPNCPEPKSFKRKADWVRHENERHRHLEWWKCSVNECSHVCYRKDNFVQHLVREHKLTEPKGKGAKSGTTRVRSASRSTQSGPGPSDFWALVDDCRTETNNEAKREPCKFCGNICSTWKKLSVHVGKHMEQIAMPVLQLAECQKVNADTLISPIESQQPPPPPPLPFSVAPVELKAPELPDHFQRSPYAGSAHSNYQGSSAGHSPVVPTVNPRAMPGSLSNDGSTYYHQDVDASSLGPVMVQPDHYGYAAYDSMGNPEYLDTPPSHPYGSTLNQSTMTTSYPSQHGARAQPMATHFDAVADLRPHGPTVPYEPPPPAPMAYYATNGSNNAAYLANYGHHLAQQPDAVTAPHSGHVAHVPTSSGTTGHVDGGLPSYYAAPPPGPSHQGYY